MDMEFGINSPFPKPFPFVVSPRYSAKLSEQAWSPPSLPALLEEMLPNYWKKQKSKRRQS